MDEPRRRRATAIVLSDEERAQLEEWATRQTSAPALAMRCRIVLAAAAGGTNREIAARVDCHPSTVSKWRTRFADARVEGLRDHSHRRRSAPTAAVVAEPVDVGIEPVTVATEPVPILAAVTPPPTPAPERTSWRNRLIAARGPMWPIGDAGTIATVVVALALWAAGASTIDPTALGDLGLVSAMSAPMIAGLAVLAVSFVLTLQRLPRDWLIGSHLLALIAMIHATPPLRYETLRYAWSWKHVGIVEYLLRTGSVDTTIDALPIYHSWPGFFSLSALLTELFGERDAVRIAQWAPFVLTAFAVLALRLLVRTFTGDRRVVWLALWLFVIGNWVGQEYFSPQGLVLPLYLVFVAFLLAAARRAGGPADAVRVPRRAAVAGLVLVCAAISSSHQITSMMMMVTAGGLFLTRRITGWRLPAAVAALVVGWAVVVAKGFTASVIHELIDSFGAPVDNATQTLAKSAGLSDSQAIVSQAGRWVVVVLFLTAAVGFARSLRRRRREFTVAVLAGLPAVLVLVTGFGGEVLFRTYLFALPFLVYLAATAVHPDPARGSSIARTAAGLAVTAALVPGFLLAHFGKDGFYTFSPDEQTAAAWVYEHGRPDTLVVELSANYPRQFLNYEHFVHVPLIYEPDESLAAVIADPAGELARWLADDRFTNGYVIITESQRTEIAEVGLMPPGAATSIERALRDSPRFRTAFDSDDAVVFELAEGVAG